MRSDSDTFCAMHRLASQFGDGLKPELAELLRKSNQPVTTITLQTKIHSSGPAHQVASPEDLLKEGIHQIGRAEVRQRRATR